MSAAARLLAPLAALLVLLPPALAAADPAQYPDELKPLLARWVEEAEATAAGPDGAPWAEDADAFLQRAKAEAAEGRVRAVMFDLETFLELALADRLVREADALPSEAERKSHVLQRAGAWAADADDAWRAYRERLDALEHDFASVRGMEVALYGAEVALTGHMLAADRETLVRDFPRQPDVDRGYVAALVRTSHTSLLNLGWADDLLDAAGAFEGLPPRLLPDAWAEVSASALADPGFGDRVPPQLEGLEEVGREARARNESVLALAVYLAEERASRATSIYVIFGDAQSRGKDVVADAAAGMRKQLDNATLERARAHGLLGLFAADAIDRGVFTAAVVDQGKADLNVVIAAWAGLDHAETATALLGAVSETRPEEVARHAETPVPAWGALAALVGAAAGACRALTGRRTRSR